MGTNKRTDGLRNYTRRSTSHDFSPELANTICHLVALGSNLSRICDENPNMPSREAVYSWLRNSPTFADQYARARQDRGDWRNDQIDVIAKDLRDGKLDANAARVLIDALKWQAAHEAPKVYADKVEINALTTVRTFNGMDELLDFYRSLPANATEDGRTIEVKAIEGPNSDDS